jgi:hypothetical protein
MQTERGSLTEDRIPKSEVIGLPCVWPTSFYTGRTEVLRWFRGARFARLAAKAMPKCTSKGNNTDSHSIKQESGRRITR